MWQERRFPFTGESPLYWRNGAGPSAPLIVLCHGMGVDPVRFADFWPRLLEPPHHVVIPAGPFPHEVRGGPGLRIGHAWYLYDGGAERFRASARQSATWLLESLASLETERGWSPSRRILVGHSQGAYFGFLLALWSEGFITDLAAVAGRLKEEFVSEVPRPAPLRRALVVHGREDPAVAVSGAIRSAEALREMGVTVELALTDGGHGITQETDRRVAAWSRGE
jgi:predicted esterase